jgi:hypothetical protein
MKYETYLNIFNQEMITWLNADGSRSWALASDENPHYQDYLAWVAEGNKPKVYEAEK